VLVVEDDADLAGIVLEALTQDGHSAVHVREPAEACRMANIDDWDAFVVDAYGGYQYPDAEYRATLRHLARHGRVVVTTGRAWGNGADASALGAHALLTKPYDLAALSDALTSPR
jgi:DNA-binding response OmpR family regulator